MTSKKPIRYNLNLLITFCNSNKIELSKDYRNENINYNTRIEGKCINIGCSNEFNKKFFYLYKTNGYCKGCTIRIGRIKAKATTLKRYGVENPMQSEEVKEKAKATNLDRYGVENPMQNAEISEKASNNAYKGKEYTWPSGDIINIQGYEKFALDELLKEGLSQHEIDTERTKVPTVWWYDESGKKHRYFVDIFIPSQNRCIEVKSTWTLEIKEDIVFIKQQAVKDAGLTCEIWVYNRKGERVKCYN